MSFRDELASCWNTQWKILTLRASREELLGLNRQNLIWGVFWVWMAGIGRAWDKPPDIVSHSGLPSVIYIFVLSAFLWLFIGGLAPKNWSIRRLATFISMTGIIGLLYAVPLEMILPRAAADTGNSIFLLIVATWRVVMLGYFLAKTTDLNWFRTTVAVVLPLSVIVNFLIWADEFEKTFAFMGMGHTYVVRTPDWVPPKKDAGRDAGGITLYDREPSPIEDPSGRAKAQVYSVFGHSIPPGYREISADDPDYMPPTFLFSILRPLGIFCKFAAPTLGLCYLVLLFRRPPRTVAAQSAILPSDEPNE